MTVSPPPIRVLFRYRDLVAPTLEAHRRIIQEKGSCWWGWWKRPTEESRHEIWAFLEQELQRNGQNPIRVGLFDSGSDQVHGAWVSAVRQPKPEALDVVELSAEEKLLVPEYYRASPFSRAWIRLTKIEDQAFQFFGHYSYDNPPPLPGFSPGMLNKLRDKKIIDCAELRGMDTTIWQVRETKPGDNSDRFLIAARGVTEPITTEPIPAQADTILHISDLHFAVGAHRNQHSWRLEAETEDGRPSLVEAVTTALNGRRVGLVIITGDLTFINSEAEFNEAKHALVRLVGILNVGVDHVVIIPGNHDMSWVKEPGQRYEGTAPVDMAPQEAKAAYSKFFKEFYRFSPNVHLSLGRRFVLPSGGVVEVCGINSSSLEQGKDYLAGMGRILTGGFADTAQKLGWTDEHTFALRILAVHHHLVPTDEAEDPKAYYSGFGMAMDATSTQRTALKKGVQLALHGHRHRAFVWRSNVYALPEHNQARWALGELSIIGCGSTGSTESDGKQNYFNLMEYSGGKLKLEMFKASPPNAFESFQRWSAEVHVEGGRLVLSDWITSKDESRASSDS